MRYALFIVHPDGFEHLAGYYYYRQDARRWGKRVVAGYPLDFRVVKATPSVMKYANETEHQLLTEDYNSENNLRAATYVADSRF